MYMYIYIYLYVNEYINTCTYMYKYVSVYISLCIHMYTYVYIYECVYIFIYPYYTYVQIFIFKYSWPPVIWLVLPLPLLPPSTIKKISGLMARKGWTQKETRLDGYNVLLSLQICSVPFLLALCACEKSIARRVGEGEGGGVYPYKHLGFAAVSSQVGFFFWGGWMCCAADSFMRMCTCMYVCRCVVHT